MRDTLVRDIPHAGECGFSEGSNLSKLSEWV